MNQSINTAAAAANLIALLVFARKARERHPRNCARSISSRPRAEALSETTSQNKNNNTRLYLRMRRRGSVQAASPCFRYRTAAAANVTSLCEGACPRHILPRRRRRLRGSEAGDTGCCAQPGVPAPSICVASSGLVVARLTPPLFHQQPDGGVGGWGTRGLHKRLRIENTEAFFL